MKRRTAILPVFCLMSAFIPAGTAAQGPPPVQGIPCAQGLPCNSLPPHLLDEIYGGSGYSAPGQVLNTPAPRGPGYMVDSYAAIAFWQSASGQPGYSYSYMRSSTQKEAERLAVTACERAGGTECVIGLWGANGHFAIAQAGDGNYFAAFAGRLSEARKTALNSCKEGGSKCKVVETIESMPYYHEF